MKGFKSFLNYISDVSEEKYAVLDLYCKLLDSISRTTNQCLYLIDFYKGEVLYVSNNPLFLAGETPEELKLYKGGEFNSKYISKKENKQIANIIGAWFKFLEKCPIEERTLYSLRYDYFMKDMLINACMTPAFLCKEGKAWLVVCNVKISTHSKSGNAVILKENSSTFWKYSLKGKCWKEDTFISLSEIERQVLRLSIQGKKEKEICDVIFRSLDGLKALKRRLFQKMDVNNITEAVSFAISYGLI